MRHKYLGWTLLAGWAALWPSLVQAADYLDDAKRLLQKGDIRAAQIQLRNAVKSDPQNAEAHFQLARVSLELGDPVAAEREAQPPAIVDTTRIWRCRCSRKPTCRRASSRKCSKGISRLATRIPSWMRPFWSFAAMPRPGCAISTKRRPHSSRPPSSRRIRRGPLWVRPDCGGPQRLTEGIEQLDRALAIEPHSAEILVQKAQVAVLKGRR